VKSHVRFLIKVPRLGGLTGSETLGMPVPGVLIGPALRGREVEMAEGAEDTRAEFGVLFVGGIGKERPGSALGAFAAALYGWLFRWNRGASLSAKPSPALQDAVLSPAAGDDGDPAHVTLEVPLRLKSGTRPGRWLLAESSWAEVSALPRFVDLAHWIWKVSTCLLVLQFVIPMRRHWLQSGPDDPNPVPLYRRVAVVLGYLVLMGVAAVLSVLLSLVLFAVAITALLPIPRIDRAVRWVMVKLSAILGDSYVLAHCPVTFAAMRTRVARDLDWLQHRCNTVAVVGHSQGAAIAHQVLRERGDRPGNLRAFITLGQGISKLHLLQEMDWDPNVRQAALRSRWLVAIGLGTAGLPALGWVASRLATSTFLIAHAVIAIPMIAVGFLLIFCGVRHAMSAVGKRCDSNLSLCIDRADFVWTDFYASADPVSNGPLISRTDGEQCRPRTYTGTIASPSPCNEVYNGSSLLTDHNSYLRNQDQFLPALLNALTTAAYHDKCGDKADWQLVGDDHIDEAKQRRRRLAGGLVAARVLMAGVVVLAWLRSPVRVFQRPMDQLTHLASPHMQMSHGFVRLVAVALITAAAYVVVAIIPRQIIEHRNIQRFFETAEPYGDEPVTGEPAGDASRDKLTSPPPENVGVSLIQAGLNSLTGPHTSTER
jgi:hypothetical protein